MTSVAMLGLLVVVSALVVRWCPGGPNCEEISQILFALGVVASFPLSVATGLVARDVADNFTARPPRV